MPSLVDAVHLEHVLSDVEPNWGPLFAGARRPTPVHSKRVQLRAPNAVPMLWGVLRPPLTRRGPGPSPEGMAEGTEFGVAQQESDLREAKIGVPEISEGQIMTKFVQNLPRLTPGAQSWKMPRRVVSPRQSIWAFTRLA